ncbi:MAG TPA: hypothetical protein VEH84_09090, partial [Alphaproteobacteria bacterium]|nr:hypothetical protein [Alphaproteobacteria bacterium]
MTDPFIPAEPPAKPRHPVLARLRAYFLAGILVTAPISITLYIAYLIVNFFDRNVGGLLPEAWNPGTYLPIGLPGLGLVMVLVGLTLIGWLTAGYVGNAVV